MASTQHLLTPSESVKRGNVEKWKSVKNHFYDGRTGTVLGTDGRGWVYSLIFHAIFYSALLLMFLILMCMHLVTIDLIRPRLQHMDSPLKQNPGVSYRPTPDFESNLIRFEQGNPASYKPFSDHIQTFLFQYENENQDSENTIDCESTGGKPDNPEMNQKVCFFDLSVHLGDECTWQNDYGYDEGQPCILFKLNKVFDWRAESYEPHEVPAEVAHIYKPGFIPVTCEGENPADRENIGNITFVPAHGFPAYYYPFMNQYGFRSPLIMAKFRNPTNGMLINVQCKAWAKNVHHDKNDQQGLVRFQLLID